MADKDARDYQWSCQQNPGVFGFSSWNWQWYQAARLLCGLGLAGLFTPAWFRAAVSLSLGALVLLDAGLYSPASSRQPSGGSIGAIIGPCIEGNRRAWGSLMNSVDDGFE